jgi:TolA-binding protein
MARGPFQGSFTPNIRPTVVHAPDALVYINGEQDIMGCPSCKRKFDLSRYITSVQVDLHVDNSPGSATVTLSIPRHTIDDFMFDGVPIITEMMEIEIFAKGYYVLEGIPQYYPIFWGLVTEVSENYSGGEHTVTIQCSDILKWWEVCKMNINPAFTQAVGQQGRSIFGNVFFGMNPYDVIYTLALQSFGDIVIGTGTLVSLFKEATQKSTFNNALSDIMVYWNQRFSKIRSNLLLYGINGVAVRGADLTESYRKGKGKYGNPYASRAVRAANGGDPATQLVFDPTDPNVVAFRTQFTQAGQVNFWQSEYETKLEIANRAKESIGFEFYMDVTGDIVFKPPFYNLDVLPNKPTSWIQDIDIIDWNFGSSESEVYTQIQLQGNFGGNTDYGIDEAATPYTSVTDYHLLRKYGWRVHNYNSEFLGNPLLMFYQGLDMLDRLNSKRTHASVTIPCRPELRLGFPVYIASKDQYWYVSGISHSIQFGQRATTSLTLTARRTKFIAPRGIGTLKMTDGATSSEIPIQQLSQKKFHLDVGEAAEIPPVDPDITNQANSPYAPVILRHPKTGRIVGYPNVVMVYTKPFRNVTTDQFKKIAGQKTSPNPALNSKYKQWQENQKEEAQKVQKGFTDEQFEALSQKYVNNRWQFGLTSAGVYTYAFEQTKTIRQFVLLKTANITVTKEGDTTSGKFFEGSSAMVRPISDDRGFEVIGHQRYGRGISLRDGSLVLTEGGKNARTSVDLQLALSGDLFETLNAQSQGLTTISTAYANPAEAVTKMQPEDLETAAAITPEKTYEFTKVGETFVSTAPLGSSEQDGLPASVEASQLSRALTLAEMTIKDDSVAADSDCACLTGRSDLAFINAGYQIKTVNPANPDTDVKLFGQDVTVPFPGATSFGGSFEVPDIPDKSASKEHFAAAQKAADTGDWDTAGAEFRSAYDSFPDPSILYNAGQAYMFGGDLERAIGYFRRYVDTNPKDKADVEARIASLETKLLAAKKAAISAADSMGVTPGTMADIPKDLSSIIDTPKDTFDLGDPFPVLASSLRIDEMASKIDNYLITLYKALDAPHQEYEEALRGKFVEDTTDEGTVLFGGDLSTVPPEGDFTPPFSSANRAALSDFQDPVTTAQQGSSAKSDIAKNFSDFGSKLKAVTRRKSLEGEISSIKAQLVTYSQQLFDDKNKIGTAPASQKGDIQNEINDLTKKIADLQQQLSQKQAELDQINRETQT